MGIYYLCLEEPCEARQDALSRILSNPVLVPLAFQINKDRDETALHALSARTDYRAALTYISLAPGSIFIRNGKNQTALQIIATQISDVEFRQACNALFLQGDIRAALMQSAFEQGVRIGYLSKPQLTLLSLESNSTAWNIFASLVQHPELVANPLAERYFFPRPLRKLFLDTTTQLQYTEWIAQLAPYSHLQRFSDELLADACLKPQMLPASTLEYRLAQSWSLNIDLPATFVEDLTSALEGFLGYLDTLTLPPARLLKILEDHELRSIEACHGNASDLIERLRYHPRIKGLSDSPSERDLYYKRLKQVLFLLLQSSQKGPYEEYLVNWISIISTGGLCAFSIEDLKMIAAPYVEGSETESHEEDTSLKTRLLKLAAEYRLRISHMLAGKYIETNVHAKDGLVLALETFAIPVEFVDPYAPGVDFALYSLIDRDHMPELAFEHYHFHGFLNLWRDQLKSDLVLRALTLEALLLAPHSYLSSYAQAIEQELDALDILNEEGLNRLETSGPSVEYHDKLPVLNDFDWKAFFARHQSTSFSDKRTLIIKKSQAFGRRTSIHAFSLCQRPGSYRK